MEGKKKIGEIRRKRRNIEEMEGKEMEDRNQ
jgi:hypothetical protein